MTSDLCKQRCCVYLSSANNGYYCIKTGCYIDREDNSSCDDELYDFSEAD